jgi:hypothetical protein
MKTFYLKILQILSIITVYSSNTYAQSTFFKNDDNNFYSSIRDIKEKNGFYFFSGYMSNNITTAENRYYKMTLYKMDMSGGIVNTTIDYTDSSKFCYPSFLFNGDTILIINGDYYEQGHNSSINFYKYDLNFNLIAKKKYQFLDSLNYGVIKISKDEFNDVIVSGTKTKNGWLAGNFILKFSMNGDTIKKNMNYSNSFPYIFDVPDINKYYCCVDNNYLHVINRDLIKTSQISVMDTFFSNYSSAELIGTDSIFMIGNRIMTWGQPGYDNRKNIIFKTIDYQGNTLNYYEINTPDTVSYPAMEGVSYNGQDIFCSWEYNHQYTISPSKIGVAKFNKSLQPQWIKYFGKINTQYMPYKIKSTSDGGCLIVGEYRKTSFANDDWRYFILKVNSQGLATFMKHTDIKIITDVNIYPNPATDNITIQLINPKQSIKSISIFDLQGKEVINKQLNSKQLQLDVSSLSSGVYLIRGETNTGLSFSRKFVKE